MGLFGKLFEKKECAICGGEIGLLGNNKLADANMCNNCADKLSPWFNDRRKSTLEQIQEQLEYREANKAKVAAFNVTRVMGEDMKVYLDEDNMQFLVTKKKDYKEVNPDVLDFTQVMGVDVDTDETRTEEKHENAQGEWVSYNPPRYNYMYNFFITIRVKHPYFEEMRFQLNRYSVNIKETGTRGLFGGSSSASNHPQVRDYQEMGYEIKRALTEARQAGRAAATAAAAPKQAVKCPWCDATTIPTANGCCEYCGGSLKG